MKPIIKSSKSIIPSCDFASIEKLSQLVNDTCDIEGVGAYKIGFEIVIPNGLKNVIETIRALSDLPIIYDHQKGGTDIPENGSRFMKACKGVDAVIIFPMTGPVSEKAWVESASEEKMPLIVGGEMTHSSYLASEGGYISDDAPEKIYRIAATLGVNDFVVPGNKPEKISFYRRILEEKCPRLAFYSPGFVTQGGSLSDSAKSAGERFHAIVGRAIYSQKDMGRAVKDLVKGFGI